MTHASSPQIAADASALRLPPSGIASLALPGCEARRFFASGAHTTRHDTEQSTGMLHVLWIVNATRSSPRSTWSKLAPPAMLRGARAARGRRGGARRRPRAAARGRGGAPPGRGAGGGRGRSADAGTTDAGTIEIARARVHLA